MPDHYFDLDPSELVSSLGTRGKEITFAVITRNNGLCRFWVRQSIRPSVISAP